MVASVNPERLIKLLGMLGSDFDGERANAAAMIAKMAKEEKKTIADLVMNGRERIVYQDRIVYRDRVIEKVVYRDRPSPRPDDDYDRPDDPHWTAFQKARRATDRRPPKGGILDQLRSALHDQSISLTGYETEFIFSVLSKYEWDAQLSDKQMKVARRIIDKIFGEPLI